MKVNATKKNYNNANSKTISVLMGVLSVLVIGAIVVGVLLGISLKTDPDNPYKSILNNPQKNKPADITNPDDHDEFTVPAARIEHNGKVYEKNEAVVNLLFLGIDSNADRRAKSKGYRSDMVMVCAVDTVEKTATLISIPRDTYTTVNKVDNNGVIKETVQAKINTAYSYAGNSYRASNSMLCVQAFLQRECELNEPLDFTLDIPVYFFASIDMDGITPVATAVGGVEVTLNASIPGVGKKGQTVVLRGENCQEYIRDRHAEAGGDLARAARQRTFMLTLAKKIKGMGEANVILTLYDELEKYVKTNLSLDNMLDFAKLLKKIDIDDIRQFVISGSSKKVGGSSVMVHDEKETLDILLDVYYKEVQ